MAKHTEVNGVAFDGVVCTRDTGVDEFLGGRHA